MNILASTDNPHACYLMQSLLMDRHCHVATKSMRLDTYYLPTDNHCALKTPKPTESRHNRLPTGLTSHHKKTRGCCNLQGTCLPQDELSR